MKPLASSSLLTSVNTTFEMLGEGSSGRPCVMRRSSEQCLYLSSSSGGAAIALASSRATGRDGIIAQEGAPGALGKGSR
eukprot:2050683-Prymnesium_polylepis.2